MAAYEFGHVVDARKGDAVGVGDEEVSRCSMGCDVGFESTWKKSFLRFSHC